MDLCQENDPYQIFRYKVDKSIAPDYDLRIPKPIYLEQMRQRCRRQEYSQIEMFLEDMALLRSNAETYNGVDHQIAEAARRIELIAICEVQKPEIREQIDEAQMKIKYM